MDNTMRKVLIPHFGDEGVLQVIEANVARPRAGEVQVQVLHSVVAGSDVNMRRGTYPFQKKAPLTPGYSMVGKVLNNGAGCMKFAPGTLLLEDVVDRTKPRSVRQCAVHENDVLNPCGYGLIMDR